MNRNCRNAFHVDKRRARRRGGLPTALPESTRKIFGPNEHACLHHQLCLPLYVLRPESRDLQRSQSPSVPVFTIVGVGMKSASDTAFFEGSKVCSAGVTVTSRKEQRAKKHPHCNGEEAQADYDSGPVVRSAEWRVSPDAAVRADTRLQPQIRPLAGLSST
jgi:hypothetical protein